MSEQTESQLSPSDFMRGRRPELFSDSTYTQKKVLDKAFFEYHLNTITARKQEYEFERFCTLLAEKELCPNLLPQTGPTGGGDSKTDSETYPVADSISANWYEGVAREANRERWAFAYSAKEQWQGKVRSDIKKIAETGRGYTVAYFMTNQFVSDKKRSEMEDELSSEYSLAVRILDRSWIVETVLKKRHEDIASETLGLSVDYKRDKHTGALDAQREKELNEIDELVTERANSLTSYALAEEVLNSALIARELERSQTEVYSRFDRAIGLADRVGHVPQQIRCKYQKAWTAFWWYEDYETLCNIYDEVESLVLSTTFAEEYEYLVNLFIVLSRPVTNLDPEIISKRKKNILSQLETFSKESNRPNNALYARSLSASLQLQDALQDVEKLAEIFNEINLILQESEILTGFPSSLLIRILQGVSEVLPDLKIIDEVFDLAGSILEKTSAEESAVELLTDRAFHKLEHGKPYEALAKIEVAIDKCASHDMRRMRVRLLLVASQMYRSIGLLWASRSSVVLALELLFSDFENTGSGAEIIQRAFENLVWIELELGRILHVLHVHNLLLNFVGMYGDPEKDLDEDGYRFIDPVLAMLISKTELGDLEPLSTILPLLNGSQMHFSCDSLLYALGYEDEVFDKLKEVFKTKEELEQHFKLWPTQPAYKDLPPAPVLFREGKGFISSRILGVKLIVSFENHDSAVNFSETLLACFESMLARYLNEKVYPTTEEIRIDISISESDVSLPTYNFFKPPTDVDLIIKVPAKPQYGSVDERCKYREVLYEIMITTVLNMVYFSQGEETIKELVEKTKSSTAMAIIMSDQFVSGMASTVSDTRDWLPDIIEKPIKKLIRKEPWLLDPDFKDENSTFKLGKGEIPQDLLDNSKMKHSEREVVSYIKLQLWDDAKWIGTAYAWEETLGAPPWLMFMFENGETGKKIFEDWKIKLGKGDSDKRLRISIIRGIDKNQPHNYRVVVSANIANRKFSSQKSFLILNRINLMTPKNSFNLEQFIRYYKVAGCYLLAPAEVDKQNNRLMPYTDFKIKKEDVNIRYAWEICKNDPDMMGLSADDDPVLPKGEQNPPVIETMEFLRSMKHGFRS